jgi:hypothetical protein
MAMTKQKHVLKLLVSNSLNKFNKAMSGTGLQAGLSVGVLTALLITTVVAGLTACQSGLVESSPEKTVGSAAGDPTQGSQKNAPTDPKNQSWSLQMRNLSTNLTDLLPLAFNADAFRDKANDALIQEKLRNLDENAKAIQHSPMQTIVDPSVNFISYDFHDQVKRVRESFSEGKKDFARYELISTSHFCIECHTRSASGPAFGTEKFNEGMLKLSPLDRAQYLTATRHFDGALDIYIDYFKEGSPKSINALQSEKAALHALVITPFDIRMMQIKRLNSPMLSKNPRTLPITLN